MIDATFQCPHIGWPVSSAERLRLSDATLESAIGVLGSVARIRVPATIAHIGVGAFARAHLCTYVDELSALGHPTMIQGVSMRSELAEQLLAPQDGLFTVLEREAHVAPTTQIVRSLRSVVTGPIRGLEVLSDQEIALVTLTVTEKGYEGADVHEETSALSRTVPGVLARGLAERHRRGWSAPVVASLDNLLQNGVVLRRQVLAAAQLLEPESASWIRDEVSFPCSVVDRLVPATTERDVLDVEDLVGLRDLAPVVAEAHRSWAISSVEGLPALGEVGVEVVSDVDGHERRKLWLLNGPHSATAYLGLLVGSSTIHQSIGHPLVSEFVRQLGEELVEIADLPPSLDAQAFLSTSLKRFANPNLGHRCVQVGADGSKKLPQRLWPAADLRSQRGLSIARIAFVTATWLAAVSGIPVGGFHLADIEDPIATRLRSFETPDLRALCAEGIGSLGGSVFQVEVASWLRRLIEEGPTTLHELI
jgi:fructuronate reductase